MGINPLFALSQRCEVAGIDTVSRVFVHVTTLSFITTIQYSREVLTRGGSRIFIGGGGGAKDYVRRTHITSANPEVAYRRGPLSGFLMLSHAI